MGHIGRQTPLQVAVFLDRLGHGVEGLAEAGHLVLAGQLRAGRQIAVADGPGRLHDAVDRRHQVAREEKANAGREHDGHAAGDEHSLIGVIAKLLVGLAHKGFGAVDPQAHGAHLLAIGKHDGSRGHLRGVLRREGLEHIALLLVDDDG